MILLYGHESGGFFVSFNKNKMWIGKNGKQSPYYGNILATFENQVATNIKLFTTSFPRVIKNN
jgi:hypothetical protein